MTPKGYVATTITIALATCAVGVWRSATETECGSSDPGIALAGDTTADLRLALNVPAFRLDVIERGTVTRSIRVAVGQPGFRTPLGHFRIDYVVWNPWWIPPDSWWARKEKPQAPGWSNPVGRVKLNVTGLVFLHGTPLEESLGSAASHACVRMSNADAVALARTVHAHAGPPLPPQTLDLLEADTSRTRTLGLARAVPIDIVYRIAEVDARELRLFPDVYRRVASSTGDVQREAVEALLRAGIDTTGLQAERLRELASASRRAGVRVPLDSLFVPPAAAATIPDR